MKFVTPAAQLLRSLIVPGVLLAGLYASGQPVSVAPKVMLDGAYVQGMGLMRDDLRSQGLIPLQEPYSGIWSLLGGVGGETTTGAVLATTGPDAIVDWVLVELRSAVSVSMVLAAQCALVQRDGDIVGADSSASLSFPVAPGTYHVAVRHRNHLGVFTAAPVTLGGSPLVVDFRDPATATFGSNARKVVGSVALLWAGDVNADGELRYSGSNNDRDPILAAIGGGGASAVLNGVYRQEDVNMDGSVKYVGQNNDRDIILVNVGGTLPTSTLEQQLPDVLSTPGAGGTDSDGNSYTSIILVNGQEWMVENLRTTTYANGDPIPNVSGSWSQVTTGAWVHYGNNSQNDVPHGKLYNWYAVADPRNACPTGWHVPTDVEWQLLGVAFGVPVVQMGQDGFVGADQNVGGSMKTTTLWNAPNTGATNASGFSAIGSGYRSGVIGTYAGLGVQGHWWNTTETSQGANGRARVLFNDNAGLMRTNVTKVQGSSVRCVRD